MVRTRKKKSVRFFCLYVLKSKQMVSYECETLVRGVINNKNKKTDQIQNAFCKIDYWPPHRFSTVMAGMALGLLSNLTNCLSSASNWTNKGLPPCDI